MKSVINRSRSTTATKLTSNHRNQPFSPRPPPHIHRGRHIPIPVPHSQKPTDTSLTEPNNIHFNQNDFSTLLSLLNDSKIQPGPLLETALNQTGIEPEENLLKAVFNHLDCSPKLLYSLFMWAEKKPGFRVSARAFDSMVNLLGKAKEFDKAWSLILDRVGEDDEGGCLVSVDTFVNLIRRYTRAGLPQPAIRTYEYAISLSFVCKADDRMRLFEVLLDSLSKEGHVRVASEYFDRKKELDASWIPSVRVYNILLNGWFRSRKDKMAERLLLEMKKENVAPTIVTYGTMVEGYCTSGCVDRAMDLVGEMKREGIEPNAIIYNPIIFALADAGRFKEVERMMEYFMLCDSSPTISTYNSLVRGFCKVGDLETASKTLKTMINRGCIPSVTTYNYFFKFYSKYRKTDEAMDLYDKMIESGYSPDRLTYHLLLKVLCEEEKVKLAIMVSREMRHRGFDMDLATSTMLIHLFVRMRYLEDAFKEFEEMLRKGMVPQYLTFQKLNIELRKEGMIPLSRKLCDMMSCVPHSTNLPNTFDADRDASRRARRTSIMRKAEAMSQLLKTCNDPRKLLKHRGSVVNHVSRAQELIMDIKKRA